MSVHRASSAPAAPWTQTLSGAAVDLMRPNPETIDFVNDIAPTLAILPRFNGAAGNWFVVDHLVLGVGELVKLHPGNRLLAAWWLLHDAHEAYIGDIITPVSQALRLHALGEFPDKQGCHADEYAPTAIARLKHTLDVAIHAAAGIPRPDAGAARIIAEHDLRMLMTERNHLMAPPPRRWGALENIPPLRTNGRLTSCGKTPEKRAAKYITALQMYCPSALRRDEMSSIPAE